MASPPTPVQGVGSEASTAQAVDDSVTPLPSRPRSPSSAMGDTMPTSDSGRTTPDPAVLQADEATQDLIGRIKAQYKAKYDDKAAALARYYEDDREQWRAQVRDLASENKQLRDSRTRIQRSAEEKDRIIFQITRSGAPDPEDPCTLCGRVGRNYVEEVGERKSHQTAAERPAPAIDAESTAIVEDEERLFTADKATGKPWDDGPGTYTLPQKPLPDHADHKHRRLMASAREKAGRPARAGDEELLATPPETEATYQTSLRENIMTGELKKGADDAPDEQNQDGW